ncbi:arginine-tRNA-protein transferase [Astrocystis sublimbata]|nr:arginine-tRNA-protein transferase [Astrocystis sublimbata]
MQDIPEDASPDAIDALSYITPMGYWTSSTCGYCRRNGYGQSPNRRSYYSRTFDMKAECYQELVDRCWRRSGNLLYRPNQRHACCPHYTIRVDSARFRPTKDQRQAVNRFNKFVVGDIYTKEAARRYPKTREEARKRETGFDLTERIGEGESQSLKRPPEPAHSFDVTLEHDDFTEEKYAVFENYQRIVHQESSSEITRDGFSKFLCNSPLKLKRLGSYHQCYRLDGQLVAVGVLDLLPHAVSSVYFLYHESIHQWSPGKLSALREIALAIEAGYDWWYPGFYIHDCPKMKYKMDYSPQQILDPDTMKWVEITDDVLAKFDAHGYLHFSNPDVGQVPKSRQDQTNGATDGDGKSNESANDSGDKEPPLSLFDSDMPGLPPMAELYAFDFNPFPVRLGGGIVPAVDVFQWDLEDEDIRDGGPKGQIAQMAAAVGLDIMPQLCLDVRRS